MAITNGNNGSTNKYKTKRNNWWIWTIVAVVIISILLMVFGKRSIIVADEDTPTNMDPAPMDLKDDLEEE